MSKVSIIIPVYNAHVFIKDCLNSVSMQTMNEGVECILIDDSSQDDSVVTISNYIKSYMGPIDFRLIKQSQNLGPSAARNRGICDAKGEYLFFLDADDTITPECIERLYKLAKNYDADYVQGTYNQFQKQNSKAIPAYLNDRKRIKQLLLNHNAIPFTPHNRLIKSEMLLEHEIFFNEQIKVREDFLWMTFVAKHVKRFTFCDTPTYIRGYNEESLTHSINKEREIEGYKTLIESMVASYDSFQLGHQKELALEALLMTLRAGFYSNEPEKQHLIDCVKSKCSPIENALLTLYLHTHFSFVLHLLIRLYKIRD